MPRPTFLESNFSQWRFCSDSGVCVLVLVVFVDSDQKGFLKLDRGLLSRMEVGLIIESISNKLFEAKAVNNLGEAKKEEVGFEYLSVGDDTEP